MPCELAVSVARHGTQPYEGGRGTLKIETSKSHAYHLSKQFSRCHGAYRIQIDVLSKQRETPLEIVVEQVYLFADPVQYAREHSANCEISLAEANKLLREGHPDRAMAQYLALKQRHPLSLYDENYKLAMKRLCIFGEESFPRTESA
jgi:hypothetical protein